MRNNPNRARPVKRAGRLYHRAVTTRLTLYERNGCHLCDEARVMLDELIGADSYARVDVDTDDELVLRYGFRLPVIALDGMDRLEAPITEPDLRALAGEL
jgi:hypothetical protein